MVTLLYVMGGLTIAAVGIYGAFIGGFFGFLIGIICGGISSIVYFALAQILKNQEETSSRLYYLERQFSSSNGPSVEYKISCSHCGKQYDATLTSCPYCGYRK